MRHVIRWSLLALALLAFSTPLEAQNKNKPKPKNFSASPQEYQQVLAAGQITGTLSEIDHAKRLITVTLETQTLQPGSGNNQGRGNVQNLVRQQQQMARQFQQRPGQNRGRGRNPAQQAQQMQQQLRQMMQRMAQQQRQLAQRQNPRGGGGPKVQTIRKEFEFQADEKVNVRLMSLPQEFDDKGKPKQYTDQELKELKGPNPRLPGYKAEFENLAVGQTVRLYVASPKRTNPAKPAAAKDKDKDVDVDIDFPMLDAARPKATTILIVKDEGLGTPAKGKPKKKK